MPFKWNLQFQGHNPNPSKTSFHSWDEIQNTNYDLQRPVRCSPCLHLQPAGSLSEPWRTRTPCGLSHAGPAALVPLLPVSLTPVFQPSDLSLKGRGLWPSQVLHALRAPGSTWHNCTREVPGWSVFLQLDSRAHQGRAHACSVCQSSQRRTQQLPASTGCSDLPPQGHRGALSSSHCHRVSQCGWAGLGQARGEAKLCWGDKRC